MITVGTQNVQYTDNDWVRRQDVLIGNFQISQPSILCLQEMTLPILLSLQPALAEMGYALYYQPHPQSHHGIAVAWKADELERTDTFTNTHCYKGRFRSYLIVSLKSAADKVYRIACCHLRDPRDLKDKTEQLRPIISALHRRRADVHIVAGDFNQDQYGDWGTGGAKSTMMDYLENSGYQHAPFLETTEVGTKRHIDHVFVKGAKPENKPYESDHTGSDHHLYVVEI